MIVMSNGRCRRNPKQQWPSSKSCYTILEGTGILMLSFNALGMHSTKHQWRKSFLKVAKENGECLNLCSKASWTFFKDNFGWEFYYLKNIFSLKLGLGLGLGHIDVIVVFCFSCSEGHKEQRKPFMAWPKLTCCQSTLDRHQSPWQWWYKFLCKEICKVSFFFL
jgi:hypothetical protein